ncbi:MAG: hypothetical protein WBF17_07495 [Phycisphaerae bacterium]
MELAARRRSHRWQPHRPRHTYATPVRKESCPPKHPRRWIGLEAARIIPGHRSAAITEVYVEKDEQQGIDAASEVG